MQKIQVVFLSILIAFGIANCLNAQQRLTPDYLFNSDPTTHVIDSKFWLFTSHDQVTVNFQGPEDYWHNIMDCQAYSTVDFIHWKHHGSILSIHDFKWATDFKLWDGDAGIAANGKFYAYTSVPSQHFSISVAVANQPQGPYNDALGKPFITHDTLLAHGIPLKKDGQEFGVMSPVVIYDKGGNPYLLFGQFRVFAVKLKPNMTEMEGKIFEIEIPLKGGEAVEYIEGPMINEINGKYYFTYMTYKNWQGKNNTNFSNDDPYGPYIQYCVSDNMFGPYADPKHLIYPLDSAACNYAHCIIKHKDKWVLAYHVPFAGKQHRQIAITELTVNEDGSLQPIYPAKDKGIVPGAKIKLTLDAFAPKREAEEFHKRKDAIEERGLSQDFHLKMKNKGWLLFKDMDFKEGATGFKIAISCENCNISNAKVEFRLDSPTGKLIGEAPVNFTYWIIYYKEITGVISGVKGIHDVYLVAKGENGDAYGRLFNVNWFTFY